jgi:hypothetical protein
MEHAFHLPTFLGRIDSATNPQEVLALLKELEQQCAAMPFEECNQLSQPVAERMSTRLAQFSQ